MRPTSKYYLCQYRQNLDNISRENGFAIVEQLSSPNIPEDLRAGFYFILETVSTFEVEAIITFKTTEISL